MERVIAKVKKILIRFDDINPSMDWESWGMALSLLDKHAIKPLLGVVPECKDEELLIDKPRSDFWKYILDLQKRGFTIAMHGYEHVYGSPHKSLVGNTLKTEFAGLSYEEQYTKIYDGKNTLLSHGIDTDVFFAPSHSYDENTLKALHECGFRYISDGKTLKPVKRNGIICIPCICGGVPNIKKRGMFTAVFHTNMWRTDKRLKQYHKLIRICEENERDIVGFYDFVDAYSMGNLAFQTVIERIVVIYERNLRPVLSKVKRLLMQIND